MNDHLFAHGKLFEWLKPKSMIEFGLGEGTEWFLNNCEEVVSVELYSENTELAKKLRISTDEWMPYFKKRFKNYNNWKIIPYNCGEDILRAEHDVTGYGKVDRGDNPTDDGYKRELCDLIKKLFQKRRYDYAFVDAGIHLRGDIVNELFGKVRVIGAHDTNTKLIYGYNRIAVPEDYRSEQGPECGEGIIFWIKND